MNDSQCETKTTPFSAKSFMKRIVHELLQKCNIPFDKLPSDQDFYDECKEIMDSEYHLPSSIYSWFGPYLSVGVTIAFTSYSHLPKPNQVHVAIYTALVAAMDDIFCHSPKQMERFNERFVKGHPQDDPILDALAKNLFDTPEYYGQIQTNLIVTATLDFVTSLMMDVEIQKKKDLSSPSFAAYCRSMSGIPVAYGMFIFPKDIELTTYIHCVPHISTYINYMNDVLSFYKEEVRGEEDNFASMLAKESLITKHEAVERLADDVAEAVRHISKGLAGNQPALDCWQSFKTGYVRFHTSSRHRYKLDELFEVPLYSQEDSVKRSL